MKNLCRLDDGRFVCSLSNNNIIVFNKRTFKSDIIIKEIDSEISDIIRLDSNILAICIKDKKIILYQVKGNNYINFQTLNDHKSWVNKIIDINNKYLVSCSSDQSIIFYYKYYKYAIHHRYLSFNG